MNGYDCFPWRPILQDILTLHETIRRNTMNEFLQFAFFLVVICASLCKNLSFSFATKNLKEKCSFLHIPIKIKEFIQKGWSNSCYDIYSILVPPNIKIQGLPSGFDLKYLALADRNIQVRFSLMVVWEF